jgi:hypothetical protein
LRLVLKVIGSLQKSFRIAKIFDPNDRFLIDQDSAQPGKSICPQLTARSRFLHLGRVLNEMHARVNAFEHQVTAAGLFIFTMHQNSSFDGPSLLEVENLNRQALVRHNNTMGGEDLLPIASTLHGTKNGFKIRAEVPDSRPACMSEAHIFERFHSGDQVLTPIPRKFALTRQAVDQGNHYLTVLLCRARPGTPQDNAVERSKALLANLTPFSFRRVETCSVSELPGAKVLRG